MREDGDNTQTMTEWEQTTDSQTAAAAAGSGAEKTTLPSFSIPSIYYLVVILFNPLPLSVPAVNNFSCLCSADPAREDFSGNESLLNFELLNTHTVW